MSVDFNCVQCKCLSKLFKVSKPLLGTVVGNITTFWKNLDTFLRNFSFFIETPVSFMQISSESESNFFNQLSFFDIKKKTVSQFDFFGNFLSCSLNFTKFVNVGNSFNFFPFSISKIRFGF